MDNKITKRISRELGITGLVNKLVNQVSFSDLQSFLLRVYELKVKKLDIRGVYHEYQSNRFVRISDVDPVRHRELELKAFSLLPGDFNLVGLSPLTPVGTTSTLTGLNQNNLISTIRNTELAADTTNILALECASRREALLKNKPRDQNHIKLCAGQTLTRGQPYDNEFFSPFFNVIALCTAGRDEGNDQFEIASLKEHVGFYMKMLDNVLPPGFARKINMAFYGFDNIDSSGLIDQVMCSLPDRKNISFRREKNSDFGKNYYRRLRFMISVTDPQKEEHDFIDGGFTDWTAKILGNKKERLLTSGIGTDYLHRVIHSFTNNI